MSDTVEVAFPFATTDPDQIALVLGEKVTVINKCSSGWWIGRDQRGQVGSFPVAYTKPVKEKPKFAVPKELKTAMLNHHTVGTAAVAEAISVMGPAFGGGGGSGTTSLSTSFMSPMNASGHSSSGHNVLSHTHAHSGQQHTAAQSSSRRASNANSSGFYNSMSDGDQRQLKQLLGLEEDDDDVALGEHNPDEPTSPEQRQAMERLMMRTMDNTAGNHRSLFDGAARRSSSGALFSGSSNASQAFATSETLRRSASSLASSLVEQVIQLRKEVALAERNAARLDEKNQAMTATRHNIDDALADLRHQVDTVKGSVQLRQLTVADLETRVAVARAALEGLTTPAYDPTELSRQLERLRQQQSKQSSVAATESAAPSLSVTPAGSPRGDHVGAEGGAAGRCAEDACNPNTNIINHTQEFHEVAEPDEADLDKDPVAKKLAKKLNRRLVEAEDTQRNYEKQTAKMKKRIAKFKSSLVIINEEITLLNDTLDSSSDSPAAASPSRAQLDDTEASSTNVSDNDDEQHGAGPSTASRKPSATTEGGEQQAKRRQMRKLMKTLTQEELDDISQYQLAEVKLREKCVKLREQLEGDNTEVAGLKQQVDKLKKRLMKGDEALQAIVGEKQQLHAAIQSIESTATAAEVEYAKASVAVKEKQSAVTAAQKLRDAAVAKVAAERADLVRRLEKETERTAAFEAELARLLQLSDSNSAAPSSAAGGVGTR